MVPLSQKKANQLTSISRKRHLIAACFAITGIAYFIPASQAADVANNFELSPEQLFNATIISASKTPEKVMDTPAAVYVLTSDDIIRSGATSIPEALRLVPGVDVARVSANSWAISIRGFNAAANPKLLVMIDGRTVYDPLYSNVYWDIQDVVLEDIDRIEVIRGPGGSLWGANAMNGVINIITKKAKDTQGNLVSATLGNQDGITEVRHGGTLGSNGFYRVYGKYLDRNDERTPAGTDAHDGQSMDRSGFRADWKSDSARNNYTLQGDIYRSGDGDLVSVPTTIPTRPENINAHGGNVLGRWNRTFSDDAHFTLQSYVDIIDRDQLLLKASRRSFDLDAQYEFPSWDRHKLVIGSEYHYTIDDMEGLPGIVTFTPAKRGLTTFSTFFQDKVTLAPKTWFLTLGSKFEHNDYTGFNLQPNARLQWQPDDKQTVWTSIAGAVRTPSRIERDVTIVETSLELAPNPAFSDEKLAAYELGYRNQLTPGVFTDISTFYNDYSNLLTGKALPPVGSVTPLIVTNGMSGQTYGVETTANWRALDTLNLSASYSLLEMQLHAPLLLGVSQETAERQSPNHQFNIRSQWDVTRDTSFDTTLYYVSALPAFNVKGYWRLDMRWGWRITDGLQFNLVGQDLLAGSHREFYAPTTVGATYIEPSVYGNLTWRF